jgi:hypothetical protein
MPRRPNHVATAQITLSTTPHVQNYLAKLVESGLHGKNPAEAGERLIARELVRLIADGTLNTGSMGGARGRAGRTFLALGKGGAVARSAPLW